MDRMDIEQIIRQFVFASELNVVEAMGCLKIFDAPLVGVAVAEDLLFTELKQPDAVGQDHMSPNEWLSDAKTVISYFLPFSQAVREANRNLGTAATEWLYGRVEGEQLNIALRAHLVRELQAAGFRAVAPAIDPRFAVIDRRSNWSERHVAFAAGLGTFSLSRSLITQRGSAGRFGSVIVNLEIEPTTRLYQSREEYCTRCGACILRCPPLAITEAGKDNAVCSDYLDRVLARFRPRYGCGKCQAGVPCEFQIPGSHKNI